MQKELYFDRKDFWIEIDDVEYIADVHASAIYTFYPGKLYGRYEDCYPDEVDFNIIDVEVENLHFYDEEGNKYKPEGELRKEILNEIDEYLYANEDEFVEA